MLHHSPHSPSLLSTPPARALASFLALGLALVLLVCHASPAWAEDSKAEDSHTPETSDGPQRLMLVIDASDSMAQTDVEGGSRMDAAKAATIDVIKGLDENIDAGLIAYGSEESNAPDNRAKGCDDVTVLAGVGKPDVEQLETKINDLEPTGYTPIGRSLEKAAEELGDSGKRSIILVSDGEDTCAPPPVCEVAKDLEGAGVDLAVHTVGFKVNDKAREELECIAQETGGTYSAADNTESLKDTLSTVVSRVGEGYEAAGTPLELKDNPSEGFYVGEGQYVAEVAGPTENGEDAPATWFKVQAKESHNTLISAATIAPITLGNDRQTVYFHTDLTATNATCDEEKSSDFASFEYPEPSTGSMLSLNADKLKEEGCDPNEWRVGVIRGGSRYEQPLPVEIMVGHEPIATGEEAGPEDPHTAEEAVFGGDLSIKPTADPQPVQGANSYNYAPSIEPGSLRDNIVAGETRYYKINVPWGQRPVAAVEFDRKKARDYRSGSLNIASPWRQVEIGTNRATLSDEGPERADHTETYYAYYRNRVLDSSSVSMEFQKDSAYAGDWYVMVTMDGKEDNGKVSAQEDYTLTVQLDGEEADGPAWRPSNEPGAEPTIEPMSASEDANAEDSESTDEQQAAGVEENKEDDGPSWMPIGIGAGIVAVIALLVGILIGVSNARKKKARQPQFPPQGGPFPPNNNPYGGQNP